MTRLADCFVAALNEARFARVIAEVAMLPLHPGLDMSRYPEEFEANAAYYVCEKTPTSQMPQHDFIDALYNTCSIDNRHVVAAYAIAMAKIVHGAARVPGNVLRFAHAQTQRARYVSLLGCETISADDIRAFFANKTQYARILKYRFEDMSLGGLKDEWHGLAFMFALTQIPLDRVCVLPPCMYETPLEIGAACQVYGLERLSRHIAPDVFDRLLRLKAKFEGDDTPWLVHPTQRARCTVVVGNDDSVLDYMAEFSRCGRTLSEQTEFMKLAKIQDIE